MKITKTATTTSNETPRSRRETQHQPTLSASIASSPPQSDDVGLRTDRRDVVGSCLVVVASATVEPTP
jgi:hypothetical protein